VLVISGLWQNGLLDRAKKLRFIQAIRAGTDQFPHDELVKRSIRLANARGVNYRAVAEHAMAFILALSRRLPEARDNQAKRVWRAMIGDPSQREDELGGKTLLVVGVGQIGGRLAQLAKAYDMRVVALRRDPAAVRGAADAVHAMTEFKSLFPEADFVALTCSLTRETEKLLNAEALGRMKSAAYLVNLARGRVVDEAAIVEALAAHRIAGAALRRDGGRAARDEVAVLENGACARYPSYGRRAMPLRRQCDRDLARQSAAPPARRRATTQSGRLKPVGLSAVSVVAARLCKAARRPGETPARLSATSHAAGWRCRPWEWGRRGALRR
jgi:lactate dehydrogenase-like 2-hydroxyacid dehydrogenase